MARKLRTVNYCSCIRLEIACNATTYGIWAPGHDAKAKSYLQRAHRNDYTVRLDGVEMSARQATEILVPALVPFLYYVKGTLSARFADDDAAMAQSAKSVQIKVGRWTYNGLLLGTKVVYATKSGETKEIAVEAAKFVA
jgi:hypothetical protein